METNPINKVDVIYSHDVNSVKLQWMLEPHIRQENVAGYDVYLSQDKVRKLDPFICKFGNKGQINIFLTFLPKIFDQLFWDKE